VRFSILKLAAAAMIAVGLTITLCWPPDRVNVWAQLPQPNSLLAPVPEPSAPPQLAAPVTVEAAPSLVVPPSLATPSPSPSEQTFNCSCFGPGMPTAWMGSLASTSYFNAQQAAQSACVAFNERSPSQPAIPSVADEGALPSLPASALPVDAASEPQQILPGAVFSSQTAVTACERCSCS
jgi:hypothetical protein